MPLVPLSRKGHTSSTSNSQAAAAVATPAYVPPAATPAYVPLAAAPAAAVAAVAVPTMGILRTEERAQIRRAKVGAVVCPAVSVAFPRLGAERLSPYYIKAALR